MSVEYFVTEARLLGSSRKAGHRADAIDTGNSFQSRGVGLGWAQFVPKNGREGQPLIVTADRSKSEFTTKNRLVPTGGAAGQVAALDQFAETALTPRNPGTGVVMPVTFNDGSPHNVISVVIPGGSLGPNGYVTWAMAGVVDNSTSVTRTITLTSGGAVAIATVSSPSFDPSTPTHFVAEGRIQNLASEASQGRFTTLALGRSTTSLGTTVTSGTAAVDTADDQTLIAGIDLDASTTNATVRAAWLEVVYVA